MTVLRPAGHRTRDEARTENSHLLGTVSVLSTEVSGNEQSEAKMTVRWDAEAPGTCRRDAAEILGSIASVLGLHRTARGYLFVTSATVQTCAHSLHTSHARPVDVWLSTLCVSEKSHRWQLELVTRQSGAGAAGQP